MHLQPPSYFAHRSRQKHRRNAVSLFLSTAMEVAGRHNQLSVDGRSSQASDPVPPAVAWSLSPSQWTRWKSWVKSVGAEIKLQRRNACPEAEIAYAEIVGYCKISMLRIITQTSLN